MALNSLSSCSVRSLHSCFFIRITFNFAIDVFKWISSILRWRALGGTTCFDFRKWIDHITTLGHTTWKSWINRIKFGKNHDFDLVLLQMLAIQWIFFLAILAILGFASFSIFLHILLGRLLLVLLAIRHLNELLLHHHVGDWLQRMVLVIFKLMGVLRNAFILELVQRQHSFITCLPFFDWLLSFMGALVGSHLLVIIHFLLLLILDLFLEQLEFRELFICQESSFFSLAH